MERGGNGCHFLGVGAKAEGASFKEEKQEDGLLGVSSPASVQSKSIWSGTRTWGEEEEY